MQVTVSEMCKIGRKKKRYESKKCKFYLPLWYLFQANDFIMGEGEALE